MLWSQSAILLTPIAGYVQGTGNANVAAAAADSLRAQRIKDEIARAPVLSLQHIQQFSLETSGGRNHTGVSPRTAAADMAIEVTVAYELA